MERAPETIALAHNVHQVALNPSSRQPLTPLNSTNFNAFPQTSPLAHKLQSPQCLPCGSQGVALDSFVQ